MNAHNLYLTFRVLVHLPRKIIIDFNFVGPNRRNGFLLYAALS